jgi:hypothetical protein
MTRTRKDEAFAQETLTRFFAERYPTPPTWEPGSEPPDYWVHIAGRRFAVEVTQIMESLKVGSITLTERGANAALRRVVQQFETLARDAGLLRGFYHIHVCPVSDYRTARAELQARLFAYLEETAHVQAAEQRELWRGRHGQRWTIQKLHERTDDLAESMSLGGAKWKGEVQEELRALLSSRLKEKAVKSERLKEDVILLLIDAYHYGDSVEWLQAARMLDTSRFHTVARVYLEYQCHVLATSDPTWRI